MPTAKKKAAPGSNTTKNAGADSAKMEDHANAAFSTMNSFAEQGRAQFESVMSAFTENSETAREHGEEALEAFRATFEATTAKAQEASAEAAELVQEDIAGAVDFAQQLSSAKSVADAIEIQRTYWNSVFETGLERTQKATEAFVETARETADPMNKSFGAFAALTPSMSAFFPISAK